MINKSRKKLIALGCLGFFLLILSLLGLLVFSSRNGYVNKSNPRNVARSFVISLMNNDLEVAKSLISVDKQEEIENWISRHQPFQCHSIAQETGAAIISVQISDDTWRHSVSFQCADPINPHCISVEDIYTRQINDEWQVTDWKFVCEVNDYCGMCIK